MHLSPLITLAFSCLLALTPDAGPVPPGAAGARIAIQVTPFSATGNLPAGEAELLSDAFESELAQYERVRVFGVSELKTMLGEAKARQRLGCNEAAERCLIEIAGALGANWLASGSIGALAGDLVITLRLRDLKDHVLLAEVTATCEPDSASVLRTLHEMVLQLISRASPEIAASRRREASEMRARRPVPAAVWWIGGAGLGTAAIGGILLGSGANLASNGVTVTSSGQRLVDYQRQITGNTLGYAGQAAIGVGLAAVATAVIVYFVTR